MRAAGGQYAERRVTDDLPIADPATYRSSGGFTFRNAKYSNPS